MSWYPKRPDDLENAKTRNYFLQDSILKILYVRGTTRGAELSDTLRLPYALLDNELRHLREIGSIKEKLEFHKDAFESMLNRHFRKKRAIRAVHARDILGQVKDQTAYRSLPPSITPELLDEACALYFGENTGSSADLWCA